VEAAYNNLVEEITIIQNGFDSAYMSYLYSKVRERFSFLPAVGDIQKEGELTRIDFQAESAYCPYVRKYTEEHIADVISIGYKYQYFEKNLRLPLLSKNEKRVLLTALVAADYKEDKAYVIRRLRGYKQYCLDGFFHFRLQALKKRWDGIVEYVPPDMGKSSTEGFLGFLAEDGEGKIFVKDGKVYDREYRLLTRSLLTGKWSAIGEILLACAERVYCFGETDEETLAFLKKYYGENVFFC
jgi:hypothetical protein